MTSTLTPDLQKLEQLLIDKDKVTAMLAPSFIINFSYPQIVLSLRKLGFDKVTETTYGAKIVNEMCKKVLLENPGKSFITSPCPTLVSLIRNKYPNLQSHLMPVVSPMMAMAKVLRKQYPDHKTVFIGPCIVKKQEAKEYPSDIDLVLTFKELQQYLSTHSISTENTDETIKRNFDSFGTNETKIYPLSGGLKETLHGEEILHSDEVKVIDGIQEEMKILGDYAQNSQKVRLFDMLSCLGGCIGGPGVIDNEPLEKRREKIEQYRHYHQTDSENPEFIIDINFSRTF